MKIKFNEYGEIIREYGEENEFEKSLKEKVNKDIPHFEPPKDNKEIVSIREDKKKSKER